MQPTYDLQLDLPSMTRAIAADHPYLYIAPFAVMAICVSCAIELSVFAFSNRHFRFAVSRRCTRWKSGYSVHSGPHAFISPSPSPSARSRDNAIVYCAKLSALVERHIERSLTREHA